MMPNMLNEAAADWGHLILHAGLQAALAAGLVFVVLLLTRRRISSQLRYAILLVVLVKFATPPFLNMTTGLFSQSRAVRTQIVSVTQPVSVETNALASKGHLAAHDSAGQTADAASPNRDTLPPESVSNTPFISEAPRAPTGFPWLALLMFAHLSGTALFIALLIRRYRSVRQVVLAGEIQQDGFLCSELARISTQLAIKRLPELRLSDEADAPFAFGALRPVIVMPRLIADQLHADQLAIVIAHELVHVRRRDLLVGWIETLVSIVWWFHPAMWWLKTSLRQTREDCCDDVLLANQLAEPARYCETLIDAASRQTMTLAEPLALGFTDRQHPAARRIRRLMDSSLFRADRLRWSAIGLTVLVALVLLPGMRPDRQAVTKTTLEARWLPGWRNLPFRISESEEAAVKECCKIAQSFWFTNNGIREFHQSETREKLEAILVEHPNLFHAQHLLGTWHRMKGNQELATELLNASLVNAPVVLTRRYSNGDGTPATGLKIPELKIECNRVQNRSLDPSLKLKFIWLITDANGEVHLPVYDTVYRLNTQSWPDGYRQDVKNLGWFESKSRIGVLPDVMIWATWSQPRDFTRTADDSPLLSDAVGDDTTEIVSGPNTYRLGAVSRGQADGSLTTEDGKGRNQTSHKVTLPVIKNGQFVDHAVIDLLSPDLSRFEIAEVKVLDSQTKIRLRDFQDGAGFKRMDKQRFHLFSWWNTLPDSVDLVLKVHNYEADDFRYKIPPKVGASIRHQGDSFRITYLAAGRHNGWSAADGFRGKPEAVGTVSEILLDIQGNQEQMYSLWVVRKDGRRQSLYDGGWRHGTSPIDIKLPLNQIDHFELLPYVEPETIYFENIQLPVRNDPLGQLPVIEFPVGGVAKKFTSDLLSPMLIRLETHHGNIYSGVSTNEQGFSWLERPEEDRSLETSSTLVWVTDAAVDFNYEHELLGPERLGNHGSRYATGSWGTAVSGRWETPLETIQKVRLKILPKQVAP